MFLVFSLKNFFCQFCIKRLIFFHLFFEARSKDFLFFFCFNLTLIFLTYALIQSRHNLLQTRNFFRGCSREAFFPETLFSNVSDTLPSTAVSRQVLHYRRKRWTKKVTHTIFISFSFIYFIHFYMHFLIIFPRLILFFLFHSAKFWFDRVFIISDNSVKLTFQPASIIIMIYFKNTAIVK